MNRPSARTRLTTALVLLLSLLASPPASAADPSTTLARIQARGSVVCGMQADNPPFSLPDSQGRWQGLDVDSCRALAAATLGDPAKATIRAVTGLTRFPALQSGEIDVLLGSTTWLTTRETALGLVFAGANYFSGQGFLVRRSLGVNRIAELDGASICVPPGSSTEVILQDWFRRHGGTFRPVVIDDPNQIQSAFLSNRCDAFTRDMTGLSGFRMRQPDPDEFLVLPEIITMEPLGAFIRKGDDGWLDIVRWTLLVPVVAEQLEIGAADADRPSAVPDVRRLLGLEGGIGASMGLDARWAANILRAVGNYGEMWQRHVAPTGLPRGLNRLWSQGGLMYAPPLR
ncbi:amino acid ABC transporter substrate-binding protein [Roseomonas sp. NAR14]|uniref:Amino acid ABC transporter substrate-binding protein n=1 Tax=Roseomonas acroporae TaxID=2937791 RepID=A0A9X1YAY7_9PROT|nr:amino acid ABC transporter substrate-binding protein [Roseomonas acroporae]MCK8785357.1 amino acid ABC transporter substrate-binding protein [Roseomonas acroporae]